MSINVKNTGDSNFRPDDEKPLKFKSAEQLNGSIFISDNNNFVEIGDIQGNKFQSLIDLLRPAFEKKEKWTQELIDNVEKLIKKHNKDKIKNKAEKEIETSVDGWTQTKTDVFGRGTEYINNDGRICNREYDIINGFKIYSESFKDSDGNLLLTEYNGQKYAKIRYEHSKVVGETTDGKEYVLKEVQNKKVNNYFYDENGNVVDVKIQDIKGNNLSVNYEGLRSEQYMQLSLDLRSGDIISGYKIGQDKDIQFNGNINTLKQLDALGMLDAHGNIVRMGGCLQESGTYIPTETDKKNLQYVFGKTKFADNFSDHNQMLDAIAYAKQNGISLDDVTVLINCDTHSDVYLNSRNINEGIADWVNTCLANNPNITDFYWVVSENMVNDNETGEILSGQRIINTKNKSHTPLFQNVNIKADLHNEESVQIYYIDNKTGKIYTQKTEEEQRPIKIHICTQKNLPDFKGQKVISTFDMDYFSNSGIDTVTSYRDNKTADELNAAFSQLLKTFAEHHIQPVLHGNCYSDDDYLPKEDLKQAKEFSDNIIEATPQKEDKLDEYKHNHKK